ncbi:MAG: hypothetical protein A2846_03025 [Candidatus Doudnabacteria bacterium RIFCSPHIGHO2_01_FULL_49_9]|uniref:Uncharacterized protein n=1 Tax=Candidatus Doudnabacteria bacterium RIFCSPHIGHO2_01_FULL_49_9 TaxID=1817827 RepID=A0A1F5P2W9_9BACT|nr:MAG: hypothetical protein A2846_03025 [Candidatus Doudnabacteria bacterium RIFCSPHIGHO2_01_FULL_49_9]
MHVVTRGRWDRRDWVETIISRQGKEIGRKWSRNYLGLVKFEIEGTRYFLIVFRIKFRIW